MLTAFCNMLMGTFWTPRYVTAKRSPKVDHGITVPSTMIDPGSEKIIMVHREGRLLLVQRSSGAREMLQISRGIKIDFIG